MSSLVGMLRSPASAAALARAFSMTGAFALTIIFLRTLSTSDAGLVLFCYTLLAVASTVALVGGNTLAMRDSARDRVAGGHTIRHTALLALLITPVVTLVAIGVILVQGRGHTSVAVAVLAGLNVAPSALSTLAGSALRGLGRIGAGTLAEVGLGVWLAGLFTAILAAAGHATTMTALGSLLLGNTVTLAWSGWLLVRLAPSARSKGRESFRSFLRANGHSLTSFFTASLGTYLSAWLPVLVLGLVGTNESVATFNAGARPAQFVSLVASLQATYLGPRFARLFHADNLAALEHVARKSLTWAGLWAGAFAALAVLKPGFILSLYGHYDGAARTFAVLTVGGLIVVLIGPSPQVLLVAGLERYARRYTFAVLAVSVVALPLLARQGIVEAATGGALMPLVYALLCWIRLARTGIEAGPVRLAPPLRVRSTRSEPRGLGVTGQRPKN